MRTQIVSARRNSTTILGYGALAVLSLVACSPTPSLAAGDCGSLTVPRVPVDAEPLYIGRSAHAFRDSSGSLRVVLGPMLREPEQTQVTDLDPANVRLDLESTQVTRFQLSRPSTAAPVALDVVFAIDTAASAPWTIEGVRRGVAAFVAQLESMGFDPAIGGIEFSDEVRTGVDIGSPSAFEDWLSKLTSLGGGDAPSSAFDALEKLNQFAYRHEATRYVVVLTGGGLHERGDGTTCSTFTFGEAAYRVRFDQFTSMIYVNSGANAGIDPRYFTQAVGGLALPISTDAARSFDLSRDEPPLTNVLMHSYLLTAPAGTYPEAARSGSVRMTIDGEDVLATFVLTQ